MDISVIVPIYNAEKWIGSCLDSIILQDNNIAIEIIAVNDGSTDNSLAILQNYAQKKENIKIVDQENKGLSAARNIGLLHSSGNWVVFVDADDILLPHSLKMLFTHVAKSGATIGVGRIKRIGADFIPKKMTSYPMGLKYQKIASDWAIEKTLYQTWFPFAGSMGGKIFHKTIFSEVNFVEGLYFEDLEILPRLYCQTETIIDVPYEVYGYRNNPYSFLNNWNEKRRDVLRAIGMLEKNSMFQNNRNMKRALGNRKFSAACNLLIMIRRYNIQDKELLEHCIHIIKSFKREVLFDSYSRKKNRVVAFLACLAGLFHAN